MNIFATSNCPKQSAQALDNLRLAKMVLESAQMICTALRANGITHDWLYKEAHVNHPCSIWARETRANFVWLCRHGRECALEHHRRRGHWHKSLQVIDAAYGLSINLPKGNLTPFVNCTKDFKHIKDVHQAYRLQMGVKWNEDIKTPTWTGGKKFKWINRVIRETKGLEL